MSHTGPVASGAVAVVLEAVATVARAASAAVVEASLEDRETRILVIALDTTTISAWVRQHL